MSACDGRPVVPTAQGQRRSSHCLDDTVQRRRGRRTEGAAASAAAFCQTGQGQRLLLQRVACRRGNLQAVARDLRRLHDAVNAVITAEARRVMAGRQ